jgi:hypothetical protein
MTLRLKKEYSYTSVPLVGLSDLFYLYLYLYLYVSKITISDTGTILSVPSIVIISQTVKNILPISLSYGPNKKIPVFGESEY